MIAKEGNQFTILEDLPNELFVEIFSYMNGVDAVLAFSYLNQRFQEILSNYCEIFDFKSKSKLQFDTIFDEFSTSRWRSLQLSNDDDTPGQIEYCFHRCPLTIYFIELESLSLLNMKPIDHSILIQLSCLTNLISLNIGFVCGTTMLKFDLSDLKQLKRLKLTSCFNTFWLKSISQLKILDYSVKNCCFEQMILTWPSKLRHLKVTFQNSTYGDLIPKSLENLSYLVGLQIYQTEVGYSNPDGKIWEKCIHSSCPLLKKFAFRFQFPYWAFASEEMRQIISSFSTPFYTDEMKCFIRCEKWKTDQTAVLYSLPYTSDCYTMYSGSCDDNNNNIYTNVKTLVIESFKNHNGYSGGIRMFESIRHDCFNSVERLHLMPIISAQSTTNNAYKLARQFGIALENLPNLYSLNIHINDLEAVTNHWTDIVVCNHLSRKIRSLRLSHCEFSGVFFSEDTLGHIIRIFNLTCRHLSINKPLPIDTIISILRNMRQLYSLDTLIPVNNNVKITMKWLEQQHIGLNYSNCLLTNHGLHHYFWLGRY